MGVFSGSLQHTALILHETGDHSHHSRNVRSRSPQPRMPAQRLSGQLDTLCCENVICCCRS